MNMAREQRYLVRCKNGSIHTVITVDSDAGIPVDLVEVHDRYALQCSPHRVEPEPKPATGRGVVAASWKW